MFTLGFKKTAVSTKWLGARMRGGIKQRSVGLKPKEVGTRFGKAEIATAGHQHKLTDYEHSVLQRLPEKGSKKIMYTDLPKGVRDYTRSAAKELSKAFPKRKK